MPEPMRLQIMKAITAKIAEVEELGGRVVRGVTPVGYEDALPVTSIFEDYGAMVAERNAPSQPADARPRVVKLPLNVVGMLSPSNDRTEDYDRGLILMHAVMGKLQEGRVMTVGPNRRAPFGITQVSEVKIGTGSSQGPSPLESVNFPHFVIPLVISYVEV